MDFTSFSQRVAGKEAQHCLGPSGGLGKKSWRSPTIWPVSKNLQKYQCSQGNHGKLGFLPLWYEKLSPFGQFLVVWPETVFSLKSWKHILPMILFLPPSFSLKISENRYPHNESQPPTTAWHSARRRRVEGVETWELALHQVLSFAIPFEEFLFEKAFGSTKENIFSSSENQGPKRPQTNPKWPPKRPNSLFLPIHFANFWKTKVK